MPASSNRFDNLVPGAQRAWDLAGAWELKECCFEVEDEFHEFMIEDGIITTATGNHYVLAHGHQANTIRLSDSVGELCADGSFIFITGFGRAVYHQLELPDLATRFSLQGEWLCRDKHHPSDTSSLFIQGACWHLIVKSQTQSHGLLHQRKSDGAVTLHSCPIHVHSADQLLSILPGNSQCCFSRCPRPLCAIFEDSREGF